MERKNINSFVGDEATINKNISLNHIYSLDKMNQFEIQNSMTFEERVNLDYLRMIISDFDTTYEYLGRFKDIKNGYKIITDKLTIKSLIQSRIKHGNTFTYKSSGGRLIPTGFSCCMMNKILRHTIAGENNIDIDIVNAHCEFLSWYCRIKNWRCDNLDNYINNREDLLKQCMEYGDEYGSIDRDTAKTMILSLMNSENKLFNKENPIYNICEEFKLLQDNIANDRKDLYKKAKQRKNGDRNAKGICMSLFLQEIENKICQCMIQWCQNNNIHVSAPCFDGLLINGCDDVETLLISLQDYVFETLDIKITLSQKKMDLGICDKLLEKKNLKPEIEKEYIDITLFSDEVIGKYIINEMIKEKNLFYDETINSIYYYDDSVKLYKKLLKNDELLRYISHYSKQYLIDLGVYYKKDNELCESVAKKVASLKQSIYTTKGQRCILTQILCRLPHDSEFIKKHFNQHPDRLPISNNRVIDFKTDTVRQRLKEDYFTFTTNNDYNPDVDINAGREYIAQYIIPRGKVRDEDDEKHIDCFLMELGYFATNYNNCKVITLYVGDTDTGKTTVSNEIRDAIGLFLYKVSADVFKQGVQTAHQSNLFNLQGKRVGFLSEMKHGEIPNEVLMKDISGGDGKTHPARKACAPDEVNLSLNFKILIPTNHIFQSNDTAFLGRLRIFQFVNKFEKNDDYVKTIDFVSVIYKYAHLFIKNKMKIEWSKQVMYSTANEIDKTNSVKSFFRDSYIIKENNKENVKRDGMFREYEMFCRDNNFIRLGKNTFYNEILKIDNRIQIHRRLWFKNISRITGDEVDESDSDDIHSDIE